jgi:hypothetical protein
MSARASASHLATVIHVALAANDLAAARAALAEHGPVEPPAHFNLEYLQLATESARLKQRMGDFEGARALARQAMAHLEEHAGTAHFEFVREALREFLPKASGARW